MEAGGLEPQRESKVHARGTGSASIKKGCPDKASSGLLC
jgi:hypothetical protein